MIELQRASCWPLPTVVDHPRWMVRLVKRQQGSARYYGFEEFEALVAAARQISPTTLLVVLLGGEAGLRAGEMRALQ